MFKDTTIMYSKAVVALIDRIVDNEIIVENERERFYKLNQVSDEVYASIAGRFWANDGGITEEKMRDMFYGDNSMANRLIQWKNDKRYEGNPLLSILQPSLSFKRGEKGEVYPDVIITFAAADTKTKFAKDRIIGGWSDLLVSDNKELVQFAKDLVPYSFYTSGGRKTLYSFYNFIPPAHLVEIGFSEYIRNMKDAFNDPSNIDIIEKIHDDIFQNMWKEDEMVPFVNIRYIPKKYRHFPPEEDGWNENFPAHIGFSEPATVRELFIGYNNFGQPVFQPFVKTAYSQKTRLYKYVGHVGGDPIYELTTAKGYYEYGKAVKENGQANSIIVDNETREVPENVKADLLIEENSWAYREKSNGEEEIVYDFRGFESVIDRNVVIEAGSDLDGGMFEESEEEEVEEKAIESTVAVATNPQEYVNNSGGADGADITWEEIGLEYGVKTNAYSFEGHKQSSKSPVVLTKEQLNEGDAHVREANKKLKRNFPSRSEYVDNLLRRNWFQVKNSDAVFAIGNLKDDNTVDGGTGWAVQMAIDSNKPLHVYDQKTNSWYEYSYTNKKFVKTGTPILTNNFAGIGTRGEKIKGKYVLDEKSIQAIRNVYEKTFGKPPTQIVSGLTPTTGDKLRDKYLHCG
jgi:hypothetical protein